MPEQQSRIRPGSPSPLGATWDGRGVNFALFSEHAEAVELCLFDSSGKRETERIALPEYTNVVIRGSFTATGSTVRMSRASATASIPTSFSSIPMRRRSTAS